MLGNRAHRTPSKTLSSVVLPENAHIEPALTSSHSCMMHALTCMNHTSTCMHAVLICINDVKVKQRQTNQLHPGQFFCRHARRVLYQLSYQGNSACRGSNLHPNRTQDKQTPNNCSSNTRSMCITSDIVDHVGVHVHVLHPVL